MTTATIDSVNRINSWINDYTTVDGARVSTPTYLDLTQNQRKLLFSGVRSAIEAHRSTSTPKTASGIVVETAGTASSSVEQFLGITVDNLRSVIFTRGGVDITLILKLQAVTGIEVVSVAEIEAAYKARIALVKAFVKANTFNG